VTEMELEGLKTDAFILRSRNVSGRLLVVCAGRTIGPLDHWTGRWTMLDLTEAGA
jgi:hypothetical protein